MTDSLQVHPDAPATALEVVAFWRDAGPGTWFDKSDEFDRQFAGRFLDEHMAAARRERDQWLSSAYGNLALVLLTDQFPRNAFRGTAHMYATDPLARYFAQCLLAARFIEAIEGPLRLFACLPFGHSESLEDQDRAVQLYRNYASDSLNWALHHRDVIARFGRFPHRNAFLGRHNTGSEQQFLDAGGFAG